MSENINCAQASEYDLSKICKCPDCDDYIRLEWGKFGQAIIGCDTCCWHSFKPSPKMEKALKTLKEIRDDNTHAYEMVCGAYSEHRDLARHTIDEILDSIATCDGCESKFNVEEEGQDNIDNTICGKCLEKCSE